MDSIGYLNSDIGSFFYLKATRPGQLDDGVSRPAG